MNKNAKIGLVLFAVYSAAYVLFVVLCAFQPSVMAQTGPWGINIAILSGFGLIFFAFFLSFLYGLLCYLCGEKTVSHAHPPTSTGP